MKSSRRPFLSADEQALLDGATLRLIEPAERTRFDQLLEQQHYLHCADLVGEQLRYVAESVGQWVALLCWNAAAFHLKDREAWIGWSPAQKRRRLSLGVNNSRFLILDGVHCPNLASRVMKLCLARLSDDWQRAYGHAVLVAESFVDGQLFRGTCYKASGWTLLGLTQGFGRARQDYYVAHQRPKQLWVRQLRPGARTLLRGRNLPQALREVEATMPPPCLLTPPQMQQMIRLFGTLSDWRQKQGVYSVASLVAVTVCAGLCGVHRGQRDLAAFVANLTRAQWEALGFPRRGNPRRYLVPKETTFFRLLSHVDSRQLERALQAWQDHVLGPRRPEDNQVAVDGKELLSSQGVEIVSAYAVRSGRWLGSERVADGSNEIPTAQQLLRRAPIEGSLVTLDALHTQTETARIITQERGGDYRLTVKGNQKGLAQTLAQQYESRLARGAFPPGGGDRADRIQLWSPRGAAAESL